MRIVALLVILARWINDLIFQPIYILDDEDDEVRLLLIHMAVENSKKESFFRALLLSIDPEEHEKKGFEEGRASCQGSCLVCSGYAL